MDQKKKIQKLAEDILMHKRLYEAGEPVISDADYDQLEEQLHKLAPDHPALEKVGSGEKTKGQNKVPHDPPMLSLAKTYKIEELLSWSKNSDIVATYKLDGVAMSVRYKEGRMELAKTRGNGVYGENVSSKVRWVSSCPVSIKHKGLVEVRGELYCSEKNFALLFEEMEKLGLEKPSNPRNIVAGILGRKVHGELARFFELSVFDIVDFEDQKLFSTELEKLKWLQNSGFMVMRYQLLKEKKHIESYLEEARTLIEDSEIGMDGVVFSYNDLALHESLGSTSHHPRYKLSYKWAGQTGKSLIKSFKWLTSRLGYVTPVAVIEPIHLSGAKITNVTLHNASYVKLFNLKIGDEIEIIRSGEVIPKFLKVTKPARGEYIWPQECPSCNGDLEYDDVRLICRNDNCPAQNLQSLLNWIVSTEIDDLSQKRLEEMMKLGLVSHASDLYRLSVEDLLKLPLTKEKMAQKLFANIEKSKNLTLNQFLTGLGISGMGRNSWNLILSQYPSLDEVLALNEEEIIAIEGFAEKTANQLVSGLKDKKKDIDKLLKVGVSPKSFEKRNGGPLDGMTFVITGTLSRPRGEIKKSIEKAGGKVLSAVSGKLTALITNDSDSKSSKAKKAKELGIPFWSEEDLEEKLKS